MPGTVAPLTAIQTPHLLLTLPAPEAAPRIVAYQRENWEHLAPWSPPRSADELSVALWRRRLERWAGAEREGAALHLMLFRRADPGGPVLGHVNLTQIVRGAFQAGTLGFALDRRHEGRGLMREALEATIHHAFAVLHLHRIKASHLPYNRRSADLLKRLGFLPEGYARDYLYIDGAWRDHVLTALVNPAPEAPM